MVFTKYMYKHLSTTAEEMKTLSI